MSAAGFCQELGLHPDGLLVLSVGRLTEQKGHIYLLEAIPGIIEQFPSTVFAIAGDGPLRAELEARAERLGISKSVHFLGMRSDVPALLQMAHIFALPSLWEGLPIALLEAMAAGLPVVATRVEGVEESHRRRRERAAVAASRPRIFEDCLATPACTI